MKCGKQIILTFHMNIFNITFVDAQWDRNIYWLRPRAFYSFGAILDYRKNLWYRDVSFDDLYKIYAIARKQRAHIYAKNIDLTLHLIPSVAYKKMK